jgi:hypothetical protein
MNLHSLELASRVSSNRSLLLIGPLPLALGFSTELSTDAHWMESCSNGRSCRMGWAVDPGPRMGFFSVLFSNDMQV